MMLLVMMACDGARDRVVAVEVARIEDAHAAALRSCRATVHAEALIAAATGTPAPRTSSTLVDLADPACAMEASIANDARADACAGIAKVDGRECDVVVVEWKALHRLYE